MYQCKKRYHLIPTAISCSLKCRRSSKEVNVRFVVVTYLPGRMIAQPTPLSAFALPPFGFVSSPPTYFLIVA